MKRKETFLRIWERPVTIKDLVGATVTMILIVSTIVVVTIALSSQGDNEIVNRIDRASQTGQEGHEGIRCVLKLKPDPERSYKRTQYLINACYTDFDKLTSEKEN